MPDPALSLLIATRDRRDELLRTLAVMVPRILPTGEVRIFDDGSSDGTHEAVAAAWPQVVIERDPAGIGYIAARNRLLAAACGDVLLSLDDDAEVVSESFARRLAEHFAAEPRCGVVAMNVHWGLDPPPRRETRGDWRPVRAFVGCAHAWRREAWAEVGPYPAWLGFYGEEAWAGIQLFRRDLRVDYLPDVVAHHRVAPGRRPPDERRRRDRWQLRSGLAVMLLSYPWTALPRRLAHAVVRRSLRDLRAGGAGAIAATFGDLALVAGGLAARLPHILRDRAPLDRERWRRWQSVAPAVVWGDGAG